MEKTCREQKPTTDMARNESMKAVQVGKFLKMHQNNKGSTGGIGSFRRCRLSSKNQLCVHSIPTLPAPVALNWIHGESPGIQDIYSATFVMPVSIINESIRLEA